MTLSRRECFDDEGLTVWPAGYAVFGYVPL
jgi:hypothetical protein